MAVGTGLGVSVGVAVEVGGMGVGQGVAVGICVTVGVAVGGTVGVAVGGTVGVAVGGTVGVAVGGTVGVAVGWSVNVGVGVGGVGVSVGVTVAVEEGEGSGTAVAAGSGLGTATMVTVAVAGSVSWGVSGGASVPPQAPINRMPTTASQMYKVRIGSPLQNQVNTDCPKSRPQQQIRRGHVRDVSNWFTHLLLGVVLTLDSRRGSYHRFCKRDDSRAAWTPTFAGKTKSESPTRSTLP